ncbi:hypothetical protein F7731_12245 [Cytobacillus depressus]|uniref:MaoC-like domain-containing protein n=1 Tax=Cytobacillus depressus TaxID=1602942 RepID=A0A6L3V7F4_9BACI|nr:MaoC/PaaZ C-terminal domain-containing protein [Cytobacillus depressus]KAB2336256.1 hypothetical protein F7731_12245 [Cytobacillus depressus]
MKSITFQITDRDIEQYAKLSGDDNPIHLDLAEANRQGFSNKVAHGMLTMAKIWSVLSQDFLLPYHIPKHYEISFVSPVYISDKVTIDVKRAEDEYRFECKSNEKIIAKGSFTI